MVTPILKPRTIEPIVRDVPFGRRGGRGEKYFAPLLSFTISGEKLFTISFIFLGEKFFAPTGLTFGFISIIPCT